jgi:nucleotide-binding universal stress UspA family protein
MAMQERTVYRRIAVAYNESAESQRALATAMHLAKALGSELEIITVMADLPAYTAFSSVGDPGLPQVLEVDREKFYQHLQEKARLSAQAQGLDLQTFSVEGDAVSAIVALLRAHKADLLVVGLHQHDFYVARLWSTVYELAQESPCNVLGVH